MNAAIRRNIVALTALALPGPPQTVGQSPVDVARKSQDQRIAVIDRVSPAVACIFDPARLGGGSGILISPDGLGITNFHVVADFLDERRGKAGLSDGRLYPLEVLGIDPGGDVAMFRLAGREAFPSAPLGDGDRARLGDPVLAMGNPFILAEHYSPSVSFGRITGLHRYQYGQGRELVYSDCLQTDAAVNPGNSGGPLFDLDGRILGINGRISLGERPARTNVGVGFAISINQIRRFIPALKAGLFARHGDLEATVRDDPEGGPIINRIVEGGAAWRAGLRLGDVILSLDQHQIRSANQFLSVLGTYPESWPMTIQHRRNNTTLSCMARLTPLSMPQYDEWSPSPEAMAQALEQVLRRASLIRGPSRANRNGLAVTVRPASSDRNAPAAKNAEVSIQLLFTEEALREPLDNLALKAQAALKQRSASSDPTPAGHRDPAAEGATKNPSAIMGAKEVQSLLAPWVKLALEAWSPDDPAVMRPVGADALTLAPDATGASEERAPSEALMIREPELLEAFLCQPDGAAPLYFEFNAETGALRLLRLELPDGPSMVAVFGAGKPDNSEGGGGQDALAALPRELRILRNGREAARWALAWNWSDSAP